MRILITGASGFIGRALCPALAGCGHSVRCAVRSGTSNGKGGYSRSSDVAAGVFAAQGRNAAETIAIGAVGPETDWSDALAGIETVVHLAARVHVLNERAQEPLAAYRSVNVAGTERLARMAVLAGVRRLVYVSSIKVNGEQTHESPFTEADTPKPQDSYGMSKLEAERALLQIAKETGLEIVILRPPLVYGPGVGANFFRMMDWVNRGYPLPLGSIRNSRSLIYLGNLVDALVTCATHPHAAGKMFLVSDGEDISTPELVRRLAKAMGRRPHLVSFPPALLRLAGLLTGKSGEVGRLLGSLRVDSSKIRHDLQWNPPFPIDQGLHDTAEWYSKASIN